MSLAPNLWRVGKWMPEDHRILHRWTKKLVDEVNHPKYTRALRPVIKKFKELIESNAQVFMLFHEMFEQLCVTTDPNGNPKITDYHTMLRCFNHILTTAPKFEVDEEGQVLGLIGFPINAILNWPMGTPSGTTAFLNETINAQLREMLDDWAGFLNSPESAYVLTSEPGGWFSKEALTAMPGFVEMFECDPADPSGHYGFTSWDNFFTRQFREGARPIENENDNTSIINACEAAPYKIACKVKESDRFWAKGEPYSLRHMLKDDPYVDNFIGGTVYQAFLSALNFHRWNSPVNGTVKKAYIVQGTYYSESRAVIGDPEAPNLSQGYITSVATRALIFIQADEPIGLMCFMAVGMAEVSTCAVTVSEGQRVRKGQEIGMFHFGGSTHCLIFGPNVQIEFLLAEKPSPDAKPIPLHKTIGKILPGS